ncbi:MAG: COX15/CtaA family protein, partial [Bacteroidia bacterium]|nr:COX15/CtaA family protein [Bacteroidia bacterium]
LWSGVILVALMVLVGGITRITGSGLSITEWKLVTGTIPPLTEQAWQEEFDSYKQIPQFNEINYDFKLADFKQIYWWEYIHRLIGRLIGVVFLIPFLIFLAQNKIPKHILPNLAVIFMLGVFQGFLGWYMVSSGLSELTSVSHLRLAAHLFTAFVTFGLIYFTLLQYKYPTQLKANATLYNLRTFGWTILILLSLQIIYGAFTAGLHAGHIYNTWPKMGEEWIAESVGMGLNKNGIASLVNDIASVQFIHRMVAILLGIAIIAGWLFAKKASNAEKISKKSFHAIQMVFFVFIVQFTLGVVTLITDVHMHTALTHQFMAVVLFMASIYFMHQLYFNAEPTTA